MTCRRPSSATSPKSVPFTMATTTDRLHQLPAEAQSIVMLIDVARKPKAVLGKLLLESRDQGVDAFVAVSAEERIDVAGFDIPGFGDQIASSRAVGLVPDGDVALDDVVCLAHVYLRVACLRLEPPSVRCTHTRQAAVRRRLRHR